jgi:uncharacterized protein (DUF111 family)
MRVRATGTGAGGRDPDGRPNVLRAVLGDPIDAPSGDGPAEEAVVLEANVDDLDPRVWPGVLTALLAAGASDAWLTPILMKKGRPAHTLSALVPGPAADAVRRVMFTESSTIGVRAHAVTKHPLRRETRTVEVGGRTVRVKVAVLDGVPVNVSVEYDDVVAAAAMLRRPVKQVLAEAVAAAGSAGHGQPDQREVEGADDAGDHRGQPGGHPPVDQGAHDIAAPGQQDQRDQGERDPEGQHHL